MASRARRSFFSRISEAEGMVEDVLAVTLGPNLEAKSKDVVSLESETVGES